MTDRRDFLYVAAGAAAAGLTPAIGRSAAAQEAPGPNGTNPQQMSERQRLIAEAHFGRKQTATSKKGMAITSHPLATREAVKTLRAGGNACDAALCASMVQTVIEPHMTGITGILSTMYYDAASGRTSYVNGGANVPLGAKVDENNRAPGPGVPGFWAGLEESLARFGTKSKKELLAPAIRLARDGFETHPFLWGEIFMQCQIIGRSEIGRAIYMPNKAIPRPGEMVYQKEAAGTLERLVDEGNEYYYRGEFAEEFCRISQSGGRNITMKDMERYAARFQQPAWGTYRGHRIAGSPPSDAGGATMIEILNILELMDIPRWGPPSGSADTLHRMIQTVNLVRRESHGHGDPELYPVDLERILSKEVAQMRYDMLLMDDPRNNVPSNSEHIGSCHVTVADGKGNVCTILHTSNQYPFATGLWVKGVNLCRVLARGVPGWRTSAGILPNIIFKDNMPFLASGSPSRSLLQNILQNAINVMDFDMPIDESVHRPRFGSSGGVPGVGLEADFDEEVRKEVEKRGVRFELFNPWNWFFGAFEGIYFEPGTGTMIACGDPRRNSKAEGV